MNRCPRLARIIVTSLLLAPCAAHAQVLAAYDFTLNTLEPTAVGSTVTASAVTKSPNITNVVPNQNLLSVGPENGSTSPALAVTLQQYFQFEVAPLAAAKLNVTALTFRARKEAPNSSPRGFVVRASVDGFANDIRTAEVPTVEPNFTDFVILLPPTFQGVAEPITFRIYTYQSAPLEFVDYDNIRVFGSVDARPVVGVFSPPRLVTPRARLLLRGNAFDEVGVARVTVNGRTAAGTISWRAPVRLRFGSNLVRVIATDVNGANSSAVNVRIVRTRP